jgi:hypothetical protein
VPLVLPLLPPVMASQLELSVAVQAHPLVVVTVAVAVPPADVIGWEVGEMV